MLAIFPARVQSHATSDSRARSPSHYCCCCSVCSVAEGSAAAIVLSTVLALPVVGEVDLTDLPGFEAEECIVESFDGISCSLHCPCPAVECVRVHVDILLAEGVHAGWHSVGPRLRTEFNLVENLDRAATIDGE